MTDPPAKTSAAVREAMAMGAATFVGSIAPAIPYLLFGRGLGDVLSAVVTVVLLAVIAETRHRARREALGTVAVFGGFDGLTSEIAVLAGQLVHHQPIATILSVGGGLAAGAAVSMGLGEWLGDIYGGRRPVALLQTFATAAVAIAAGVAVSILLGAAG